MDTTQYKLIDSGSGRRLEEFNGVLCNRSAPMAMYKQMLGSDVWKQEAIIFDETNKSWSGEPPEEWCVSFGNIKFKLEPANNGQIGIFPEQFSNWEWLQNKVASSTEQLNILNGFAHTGGSTIAVAKSGAQVCHLDAARSANTRAQKNAELSGCSEDSIRWITEDAVKFMRREVKRGNKYDGIILDPPAFGRMKKVIWKFEKDMPELLRLTSELLSIKPSFLLLTSHNTGWNAQDQLNFVNKVAPELLDGHVDTGGMNISSVGNDLSLGVYLRVEYDKV